MTHQVLFRRVDSPATLSFYEVTPLVALLERPVDFDRLNSGATRVSVGATHTFADGQRATTPTTCKDPSGASELQPHPCTSTSAKIQARRRRAKILTLGCSTISYPQLIVSVPSGSPPTTRDACAKEGLRHDH